MRFSSLSSGSSGNATFISSGDTRILLDQGLPVKTLVSRLTSIGESLSDLTAIVVSHGHGDHVSGLARTVRAGISRGRAIPAYLTPATADLIDWEGLQRPPVSYFEAGSKFEIGDLQIQSFSVSHDCQDPVAFTVTDRFGAKSCVAVDLRCDELVRQRLSDCSRREQLRFRVASLWRLSATSEGQNLRRNRPSE